MKENQTEYRLRYAAGTYWLLHMTQPGLPFEPPLLLNDAGAFLWERYAAGAGQKEAAAALQEHCGITKERAAEDTARFWAQLKEHGI